MRVFIGMMEVAGFCSSLKKGFADLGISCTFVALSRHRYSYGREDTNGIIRLAQSTYREALKPEKVLGRRLLWRLLHHASLWLLFLWAALRHDKFIFVAGGSILGLRELWILKLLRRRMIFVFLGSDSRPPFCDGGAVGDSAESIGDRCARAAREKKLAIDKIDRFADVIVDHPLASHFHSRRLVKFTSMGLPYAVDREAYPSESSDQEDRERRVRILHAPSDPRRKGTAAIREIVSRLIAGGNSIEFIEVTGVPNDELLRGCEENDERA